MLSTKHGHCIKLEILNLKFTFKETICELSNQKKFKLLQKEDLQCIKVKLSKNSSKIDILLLHVNSKIAIKFLTKMEKYFFRFVSDSNLQKPFFSNFVSILFFAPPIKFKVKIKINLRSSNDDFCAACIFRNEAYQDKTCYSKNRYQRQASFFCTQVLYCRKTTKN